MLHPINQIVVVSSIVSAIGCSGRSRTPQPCRRRSRTSGSHHPSLGFQNRRARALIRFSSEYEEWDGAGRPGDAEGLRDLYAVGDYAVDSWAIFVDGRRDVAPTDLKADLVAG